jgi:hypothetical protein
MPSNVFAQDYETPEPAYCNYEYPAGTNPKYGIEFLGSRKRLTHTPGELDQVEVIIKNTGTIPLYSDDSGCKFRPITRLGTAKSRDRGSILYTIISSEGSGWLSVSRIKLDQKRLDPGQKGSFTFWIKVPQEQGIYREFFDVVVEGKQWLGNEFPLNFDVGEYVTENRDLLTYIDTSRKITKADLNGQKSIEVDISSQRLLLKIGDITIRNFPVSTGTYRNPTPYGYTQIYYKQEVRVAAKWPHYIMPKWLYFRHGGYGIHALPSIAFDNGYYWTEALNHIGSRRSHGCIRLLPWDAVFAYDFTEVGMPVWVHE